jgi:uncharacterized protein (TIGR02145 family)
MRRLFFFLAVSCTLQASAQSYSISFAGTGLSTVKVQNLATGVIVDVPAGDVLLLSVITGISEVNEKSSGMKIYPNPMTDNSTLEILPPSAGNGIISVSDMTGKVLTQTKCYLENSVQEFNLSGIKSGLHIINVQGKGYQISEKFLSNGKSYGTPRILKISSNIELSAEKKSIINSKGVQGNVNMNYSSGQRLKYTAVSGNNSTVMTDIPSSDKTVTFTFTECKDGDNNYYPVVQINSQLWMAENLKTTRYNDGTAIPKTDHYTVLTTGAYINYIGYVGDVANTDIYGRLYNWYAVDNNVATKESSNGGKNVCPAGWHVPADAEWTTLVTFLGGSTSAGGKLKESNTTHWTTPNSGATNETGFTALPGGFCSGSGCWDLTLYGYWWSSTEFSTSHARYRYMFYTNADVTSYYNNKQGGFSVRCVRD